MNEGKSKVQPWQLVLILILVLAFFGGLYVMNEAITTKLDNIAKAIDANGDLLKLAREGLGSKMDRLTPDRAAAQPQEEAAEEEAAEGDKAEGDKAEGDDEEDKGDKEDKK